MSSKQNKFASDHEQNEVLMRAARLGFGNHQIGEMIGLPLSKVRYRREAMGAPGASRVVSTRNNLRRKNASARSEWVISLGIFQAYRLGAMSGDSTTDLILTAYEDYLQDYQIRSEFMQSTGANGLSVPEKVVPNVFYQSCVKMAEGCLYLERCPCRKTYSVVDISDDDNDMVPRGCPCNRLTGKDEVLSAKRLVKITEPDDNDGQNSVAAE
tara:strand:- start:10413 stop:11048 length:636 start_codon:yes stop_codon:yes gene_type:complete